MTSLEIHDQLTETEQVLLTKLCEGLTFRQIDQVLNLELGTAHRRRKPLFRKLGVRTRREAYAAVYPLTCIQQADLKAFLAQQYGLARREQDVITLSLCQPELSRRQMGELLGISDDTVRLTINRANKKLHVRTRAEAVSMIYSAFQDQTCREKSA